MDDHNHNHSPQEASDDKVYRWIFRDFITPNPQSFVHVTGHKATLDALDFALSSGACAHRPLSNDSVYTPILIAINHVCNTFSGLGCLPVTLHDLVHIQFEPLFQDLLDQYASRHHLSDGIQLTDNGEMTGDCIAVLLEALALAQMTPEMELGVVFLSPDSLPHVCHYPPTAMKSSITAWIVVDTRSGGSQIYGIGSSSPQTQQQGLLSEGDEVNNDEPTEGDEVNNDEATEGNADETLDEPLTERRKTAARIVAQQIPLPANLTAADILTNHKDRLQYNNMLKVALVYSNQRIAEECKASQDLKQPSGIVKRITTALAWLEGQYNISTGALRAVFDQERKDNGIAVRGKGEAVNDAVNTENATKIQVAMAWVKTGGPRPKDV